jgi:hypothetical protein
VFQPTPDGKTVFDDYARLSASGKFARLPYLAGENDNEAGYYKLPAFAQGRVVADKEWEDFNLEAFTCPTAIVADSRAKYGVPMWRFRYFADWDNLRLYPTSGAYHGSDVFTVFGSSAAVTGLPDSKEQEKLEALMQKAWAAFGDDPAMGLKTKMGWPRYNSNGTTLIRLGYENSAIPSFVRPDVYDAPCASSNTTAAVSNFTSAAISNLTSVSFNRTDSGPNSTYHRLPLHVPSHRRASGASAGTIPPYPYQ